ncbi:MAG: hypothetical protein V3V08_25205 [Nannocystaceae bacterium]
MQSHLCVRAPGLSGIGSLLLAAASCSRTSADLASPADVQAVDQVDQVDQGHSDATAGDSDSAGDDLDRSDDSGERDGALAPSRFDPPQATATDQDDPLDGSRLKLDGPGRRRGKNENAPEG